LTADAAGNTDPDESDCASWHDQVVDSSEAELAKMYARARQEVKQEVEDGMHEQDELALDPRGLHERYAHLLERGWTDWPVPVVAPWEKADGQPREYAQEGVI
jgi:hypothetical protein